jgi:hypothetical protein
MTAQELLGQLKAWALEQASPISRNDFRMKLQELSGSDARSWSDAGNAVAAADLEQWLSETLMHGYRRPARSVAALIDLAIAVCVYRSRLREEWVAEGRSVPF